MWLLVREQEEHAKTRAETTLLHEKRLEFAVQTLKGLSELKASVDALASKIRGGHARK